MNRGLILGLAAFGVALPLAAPAFADADAAAGPATASDIAPNPNPPSSNPPTPPGAPPPPETRPIVIDATPPLGLLPTPDDALIDPRMARSWGAAKARRFIATTVDVGFVYLRPRVSFGYGKPFTRWFGVDLNPIAQTTGLGAYGGLRLEVPYVDLRVGPRFFSAFTHTYLDPHPHYDRISLEVDQGNLARVLTMESELDSSIPVGPGNIALRGSLSYVANVPTGKYVFEETLHIITKPPWVWRVRGGYLFRLGEYSQHSIGVVADFLDVPGRDDSKTVRVGPLLRWVLSRRVEVRGSFVVTVISPDRIGLIGSDFTELGVRYRWATE